MKHLLAEARSRPASFWSTNFRTPTSPRSRFSPASPGPKETSSPSAIPTRPSTVFAEHPARPSNCSDRQLSQRQAGGARKEPPLDHADPAWRLRRDRQESSGIRRKHATRNLAYRRAPLQSAREEEAARQGCRCPAYPVAAIRSDQQRRRRARPGQPHCAMRKRSRSASGRTSASSIALTIQRDEVVQELAEAESRSSSRAWTCRDTPEVRDLFACLNRGRFCRR